MNQEYFRLTNQGILLSSGMSQGEKSHGKIQFLWNTFVTHSLLEHDFYIFPLFKSFCLLAVTLDHNTSVLSRTARAPWSSPSSPASVPACPAPHPPRVRLFSYLVISTLSHSSPFLNYFAIKLINS